MTIVDDRIAKATLTLNSIKRHLPSHYEVDKIFLLRSSLLEASIPLYGELLLFALVKKDGSLTRSEQLRYFDERSADVRRVLVSAVRMIFDCVTPTHRLQMDMIVNVGITQDRLKQALNDHLDEKERFDNHVKDLQEREHERPEPNVQEEMGKLMENFRH